MDTAKLQERYGKSEHGNFFVVDTIGTPHPYCIGTKHVSHAADNFCGRLSRECVEDGEKKRIFKCEVRGCTLPYAQHETALLVECKKELKGEDGKVDPELEIYLKSSVDKANEDKYAGFAFIRG